MTFCDNCCLSAPRMVTKGIPQGSNLSTPLFIINDLFNQSLCSKINVFTDDIACLMLYKKSKGFRNFFYILNILFPLQK